MLLDVQMPEMDGFEVAARMRATPRGRELPIIFLTAIHSNEQFARRGYASGAADYIAKPFDVSIVRARVSAFVDLFKQRETVRSAQMAVRTQERDDAIKKLVAFERIAAAALGATDLPRFLRELLAIFMSVADAAESATIVRARAMGLVLSLFCPEYLAAPASRSAPNLSAGRRPHR